MTGFGRIDGRGVDVQELRETVYAAGSGSQSRTPSLRNVLLSAQQPVLLALIPAGRDMQRAAEDGGPPRRPPALRPALGL